MKKNIYLGLALAACCSFFTKDVKAQLGPETGTTTVTIDLSEALSISVAGNVNIEFATAADYNDGKTVEMPNHLTITSTRIFDVSVQVSTDYIGDSENIDADMVNISFPSSVNNNSIQFTSGGFQSPDLSTTAVPAIINANAVVGKNLDVDYSISSTNAHELLTTAKGEYVATVTYTITQD
jgi:hypothetical protein